MNERPVLTIYADTAPKIENGKYLGRLWRRKSRIMLLWLGVSVSTAVVAMRLPNVYRAETTVLVNPQKVNENRASTTAPESAGCRPSTPCRELISPTQFAQLVDELNMYPELRGKVSTLGLVARMQSATAIAFQDSGHPRLPLMHIAFTDTDPDRAARATNRIASLFIDRNIKAREQQIQETLQLLESELGETKQQLELKEHALGDLTSRSVQELPESKQHYVKAVDALRNQLRNSQERVAGDRHTKGNLESMARKIAPATDLHAPPSDPNSLSQARLAKLEAQIKDMLVRYGPNYPDVRKLRNEINQLKVKVESEKSVGDASDHQGGTPPAPEKRNPVVEAQVSKLDQDIEDQTKAQAKLQKQIDDQLGKFEQAAAFEQQIAELTRDTDSLRTRYSQLQEKKLSARMAGERELASAGEEFRIIDRAVPPESPHGPRRTIIIIAGVLLGLLCGIGGAFLVEISDKTVRNEREAAQIFGTGVLAGIPRITTLRERAWARCRMASLTAGTAAVASALGFLIAKLVV